MRKAALIFNPAAGRRRERRAADVERAAAALRELGVEVLAIPTRGPGTAGEQAMEAVRNGCDTVFACGGDGTIHEVLQGLIAAGGEAALAALPLGTGNALVNDLGIFTRDPARVARAFFRGTLRRTAAGKIEYFDKATGREAARHFALLAGIGADATMLYRLNVELKKRHGMLAYWLMGWEMFARHDYPPFEVEFTAPDGRQRREIVSQAMAVRIRYFHPVVGTLAPRARLERDDFEFVLFKTRNRFHYLLYYLRCLARGQWQSPGIETFHGASLSCRDLVAAEATPAGQSWRIYAEADGEFLGKLPVRIAIVPSAFTLLIPARD